MLRNIPLAYPIAKYFGLKALEIESSIRRPAFPVFVYSMGKVGTSSVVASLKKSLRASPVYHFHTLIDDRIRNEEDVYERSFSKIGRIHDHLLHSLTVKKLLSDNSLGREPWKVVTLVRDPVARNISSFFQTLHLHDEDLGFSRRIQSGGDSELISDIAREFAKPERHVRCARWFDDELKRFFDIDVMQQGFDHRKGYKIYHGLQSDVLIIRLENLNENVGEAFLKFLGIDGFQLDNKQVSSQKYYADVYKEFLSQARLPDELLKTIYNSKYARTFYSSQEIEKQLVHWSTSGS